MKTLTPEQITTLNGRFDSWVRGNKHLNAYTSSTVNLIQYKNGRVVITLDYLIELYRKKFVIGKLKAYGLSLISKIKEVFVRFLEGQQIEYYNFTFHFIHGKEEFEKFVTIMAFK